MFKRKQQSLTNEMSPLKVINESRAMESESIRPISLKTKDQFSFLITEAEGLMNDRIDTPQKH